MRIWPVSFMLEHAEVKLFEHPAICIIWARLVQVIHFGRVDECDIQIVLPHCWGVFLCQMNLQRVLNIGASPASPAALPPKGGGALADKQANNISFLFTENTTKGLFVVYGLFPCS